MEIENIEAWQEVTMGLYRYVVARNDRTNINIWTVGTSSGPMGRILPYGNRYPRNTSGPCETEEDEDDEDEDSEK